MGTWNIGSNFGFYLNQFWFISIKLQWHSSEGNFTRDTPAITMRSTDKKRNSQRQISYACYIVFSHIICTQLNSNDTWNNAVNCISMMYFGSKFRYDCTKNNGASSGGFDTWGPKMSMPGCYRPTWGICSMTTPSHDNQCGLTHRYSKAATLNMLHVISVTSVFQLTSN